MGESNSKIQETNENFLKNFQKQFVFVQDHLDNRFGRVKIYQSTLQEGMYIAQKKTFSYNKEEIQQYLDTKLKQNLHYDSPFLLKLYSYQTHDDSAFICGSVNDIETYHELKQIRLFSNSNDNVILCDFTNSISML
ncbi:hypothetical protein IMG5_136510 [Ichthyophthirius multifiliis]|uniref:Uncharacterized protein n=1 Tax=Ichthyophthirius multifiliis TaxID=5932 RepID=G0QWY9_ICHMU|nr:hypothetical protein IMG5_136510 [Ichthyophthirius multifiliis]EGR30270.1 hypothetical protein IMG5_136510 [Ichthyophthirius multifiliis]|eukprot:XP_004065516.1 hypothetical protein IMG5_136510 [Ichthyophthirius multifiliis]